MGDCWRELARRDGVDVKVVVDVANKTFGGQFNSDDILRGLDWSDHLPDGYCPDVAFIVGWHNKLCRQAALKYAKLRATNAKLKLVCCFDMPWEWRVRKIAARFVLWHYLRRFDAALIPGMASYRYARWLGFDAKRIFMGMYGTNVNRFGQHVGGGGFLYVGREALEKGLDVLRKAHDMYKAAGGKWPLNIANGVSPDKLGDIYAKADCFVLASRFEPWGVVLAEAAAAGLPIICTDKCGARHEVVKGNGIVVRSGDAQALADALSVIENGRKGVDGELGRTLAQSYSCAAWADRVLGIAGMLTK